MRNAINASLEKGRVRIGRMRSDETYGTTGMFHIVGPCGSLSTT